MTSWTADAFEEARDRYAELGVDVERALDRLERQSISLHCWQGDDVRGFESSGADLGGGLAVTGSYPGRARDGDELRADLGFALTLIPGRHRINLHASYAETGGTPVDRDALTKAHFQNWIEWARERGLGLDFNPTFFAHRLAADGRTLSHSDRGIRRFWIEHGRICRRIGAAFGEELGTACVTNVWIPDGSKDEPADRQGPRLRLLEALDAIFEEPIDPNRNRDAVEGKLFGIGAEAYTVGSHEFYLGYAITRRILLCLDTGHFHPTERVSDKLSAVMPFLEGAMLHVSRGVRWDSDHVVTLNEELTALAQELVRGRYLDRVHMGLDYFDASINRVAAWVIGARNWLKALLRAFLEPTERLQKLEAEGNLTARLALLEELESMPWGAVWNHYCERQGIPPDNHWIEDVFTYEREVLAKREQ